MMEGLLSGVVSGLVSGVIVAYFLAHRWRPRLSASRWITTAFVPDRQVAGSSRKAGQLFKLRFMLTGRVSPEWGAVEIEWRNSGEPRRRVFAKWDERAMPLDRHRPDEFRPELVPATYYQPLVTGRVYDVPVLFEDAATGRIDVFSGWWFGRSHGYKEFMFGIDPARAIVSLHLVGANGLDERLGPLRVSEVCAAAIPADDARASIVQERLRMSLRRPGLVNR